jgi:Mg-chelatase subunit ChlD
MSEVPLPTCEETSDEMASVLDGTARPELLQHVASCDTCRDARYEALRAKQLVAQAGADFALPRDLAVRLALAAPAEQENRDAAPSAEPERPPPETGKAAAKPPARVQSLDRLRERARRFALPALAVAAAASLFVWQLPENGTSSDDPQLLGPPWRGKVARVVSASGRDARLEICAPGGGVCRNAREGDDLPAASELATDQGTLAELELSDGSKLSLDRATRLALSSRGRGARLVTGGIVADVARERDSSVRFEFKAGHLDVLGTKFSLRTEDDTASVQVVRGEVRLASTKGETTLVMAGEEGRVYPGSPPITSAGAELGEAIGWSEAIKVVSEGESEPRPRALGELKAKKPGGADELAGAVELTSHAVRVKIAGSVARTEVEEVFTNRTDDVLEGIFRFPLPPDAKIERLALDVDGRLEEGAFVDRERAAAIWRGAIAQAAPKLRQQIKDEIVWVPGPWKDPALLEWQRGGRFELRIYPIPKRGARRVVLAYSQLVSQSAGIRRYSYPLGMDPSGSSTAAAFSLDVQVRGHDQRQRVRSPGWEMDRREEGGAERLSFDARSFAPSGDFTLEYALPDAKSELSAWAYRDASASTEPYVALALRPRLPKLSERGAGRAVALVVDASRSLFGENYRRATALAARMARDLDAFDRLTVLACDSTCRALSGELLVPGAEAAREVRRFLEQEPPEGASDVTLAIERGFAAVSRSGRAPHVVYIGDGASTVGPIRPGTMERAVREKLPREARVTTVGVGPESDGDSLAALARGGNGTALPYVPGQPLADAALAALGALYGAALSDVRLDLPEGISQLAPARLDPILSGSEVLVVGRMNRAELRGEAVLRGSLNGRPFEQRYPLELKASETGGNAFVPRLFAAGRIALLERDGSDAAKAEAIALSTRHSVASRYTSLLVLESEAMYKAFGLDNSRKAPEYTADYEADGTSAEGELALSEDEKSEQLLAKPDLSRRGMTSSNAAPNPYDADRFSGSGRGSAGPTAPKKAAPRAEESLGGSRVSRSPGDAPAFAEPPPAPVATVAPQAIQQPGGGAPIESRRDRVLPSDDSVVLAPRPRARPMVPMRRIWERKGEVLTDRLVPQLASGSALAKAELEFSQNEARRESLRKLLALRSAAGDLEGAARLAERWLEKEPLDPDALTALADLAARRGERENAIRMLGSVLDVRPFDTAAHKRLARLERWSNNPELGCRHSIAMADGKIKDVGLVSDAVRCARAQRMGELAEALLAAAAGADRPLIEKRASEPAADDAALSGDLRIEASWSGNDDLDLALIDIEGHRISWLGAATRSVISARDATSTAREALAVRGAAPGEYVLELTRAGGGGSTSGDLLVTVAGTTRRIPFTLDERRKAVALVRVRMQSRLVPL